MASGILAAALVYLAALFAIAYYADKRADAGRSVIANPVIYALSIAVYCTAWTFYGSVGRAAATGVGFLPIYLGPTLAAVLWWFVLRKIIRIAKTQRITSIADFIASRYGKSALLGGLVTLIAVTGILPYIALQLKAVATSYGILSNYPDIAAGAPQADVLWDDTALIVTLLLAAFTILFGTRHIDATERHEGMVAAIAAESVVKLLAFLAVGIYVTFVVFDGPAAIFAEAAARESLADLATMNRMPAGYASWLSLSLLSMLAIVFLPRQFQIAVVENVDENHVARAMWLFPLYLLLINLFVLPLALGGRLLLGDAGVDPDTYVLTVPMAREAWWLALFVFIGGLSAATGMVIVATISLSTMVCNDLVMPLLLRIRRLRLERTGDLSGLLLGIRRGAIVAILLLGYLYYRVVGESYALVSIGLVSFVAAAQFAPAVLAGIYWRHATQAGAITGLLAGFAVWCYTLLLPALARSGALPDAFIESGAFGIGLLKPYALFGLNGLDTISHAVFWSLLANVGGLVLVSTATRQSALETIQATQFVRAMDAAGAAPDVYFWRGETTVGELARLTERFLGAQTAQREFERYASTLPAPPDPDTTAEPRLVAFVERLLAGAVGAASAKVLISSSVKGEGLTVEALMTILDETSQVIEYSRQLEIKSAELEAATAELREANARLTELDSLKDEFVSTVSHELRTPLTSIRAFLEILRDDPELPDTDRKRFLDTAVLESERLTRLINNVLDLSRIEAGRMRWDIDTIDLRDVLAQGAAAVAQLFHERDIVLEMPEPAARFEVEADFDKLVQVMINLLSNAAKFCAPGHGRVRVDIDRHDDTIEISVTDNGPGIPADQLAHIFDRFRQISDSQRGKPAGSGLGLAICQRIVEHHGGRIQAESAAGNGSTFRFSIPVVKSGASG